jgi:hypothetical protein
VNYDGRRIMRRSQLERDPPLGPKPDQSHTRHAVPNRGFAGQLRSETRVPLGNERNELRLVRLQHWFFCWPCSSDMPYQPFNSPALALKGPPPRRTSLALLFPPPPPQLHQPKSTSHSLHTKTTYNTHISRDIINQYIQNACSRSQPASIPANGDARSRCCPRLFRATRTLSIHPIPKLTTNDSQRQSEQMTAEPVSMRGGGEGGDICCGL